ncbi:hydrolase [Clostridium diolis]|uniref:glycoside hydrolase family 113 n=1 Tax=Clostridium diolis TaxID=223919 RepID=UPI000B3FEF19|nr:hydrolase [Clostridium diolis]OVE70208.1 hydrolase [Clostridium diolis]
MKYINNCKTVDKLKNIILIAIIFISFFIISSNVQAVTLTNDQTSNSKIGWIIDGKKIKSGSLSTDYNTEQVLNDINKFQLNTLNIPVMIDVDNISSSNMIVDKISEEKAINLIKQLKNTNANINVILEPYPWIEQGTKAETEWKPNNMNAFFLNWKTNVLKTLITDIAVPYNVTALNIGSNLVNMESEENNWCDIIDYVRTYYKGFVTYRTNKWDTASWAPDSITAYNSKLNNKLFSKVDFISIAAYFELTNNPTNTVENLTSAIENSQIDFNGQVRHQNIKQEIKNFYDKWNKPIFFGELGFPKFDYASFEPWNWNPYKNNNINNVEQANCFEAYRREFQDEPWFLGFSIFAVGEQSNDKHYYPSQESTEVIKKWYSNGQ